MVKCHTLRNSFIPCCHWDVQLAENLLNLQVLALIIAINFLFSNVLFFPRWSLKCQFFSLMAINVPLQQLLYLLIPTSSNFASPSTSAILSSTCLDGHAHSISRILISLVCQTLGERHWVISLWLVGLAMAGRVVGCSWAPDSCLSLLSHVMMYATIFMQRIRKSISAPVQVSVCYFTLC